MTSDNSNHAFDTVLIANRGEIACRIIATLRRLGIRSVAVYSDPDAAARHVHLADEAVRLGPAAAARSYLNIEAIIEAARRTGAQAIHPGYGFLAENTAFAQACADAGIVFIGPSAEAIATMGDKITAKLAVAERGVPTVPGIARPGLRDEDLIAASADIGYPLLIKPSAGGGGKGMHVVESADELAGALVAARREAAASFGDDALFLERYVHNPRHIEVQILADAHGTVLHLGERECSLQRRHQKVIEEAPSPLLDAQTRARIGEAACETARSVDYRGAGTVEFIVSADHPDEFFFMEMNTRLQVEHPVTEQVTGVDLVEQQLRIAAGAPLAFAQEDIRLTGHSIEARVYAEDPRAGFLPTGGRVKHVRHPAGEGVRVDSALEDGLDVSSDYDPMLAKVIAWGPDRDAARRRLVQALDDTAVFGITTNIEFLRLLLELPAVVRGDLDTGLIGRELEALAFAVPDAAVWARAALLLDAHGSRPSDPWRRRDGWRLGPAAPRLYALRSDRDERAVVRVWGAGEALEVAVEDGERQAAVVREGDDAHVAVDGHARSFAAVVSAGEVELTHHGATFRIRIAGADHAVDESADEHPHLDSPMPGTVVMVPSTDGQLVEHGDPVVVVEAMKMEHVVRATVRGTVALHVSVGDQVARGQTLATVTAAPSGDEEARPSGEAGRVEHSSLDASV
jgi:acetyl-CoA/propionyl-CoA carboxylase biotin carboxyl carrier protein